MAERTSTKKCLLILEPISKRLAVVVGSTIYEAIKKLSLGGICGGKGWCGKCIVQVVKNEAKVSPPTEIELKHISPGDLEKGIRLACQARILDNSRIVLSERFFSNAMQILTSGDKQEVPLRPRFWKLRVHVNKEYTDPNVQSDLDRLRFAIKQEASILNVYNREIVTTYECLKEIPSILREEEGVVTATLETNIGSTTEPILLQNLEAGDTSHELFGVAIDLGTTTIVGYLIDLRTGQIVAIESMLNPQTSIGEDIITRMNYVVDNPDGMKHAQGLVHEAISKLIENLTTTAQTNIDKINEISIAGNTTMHHIFFGLPVAYLGRAPYPPVMKDALSLHNFQLHLKHLDPYTEIYSPPNIGGFVGADVMADLIAARMDKMIPNTLLIDIGTNGELVLGNQMRGLWSASCAAGSALEGAHIHNGMRAASGAIEGIHIDPETWVPTFDIIGDNNPVGICGSGIVDVAAEMLRAKIITRSGNFNKNHPQFSDHPRIRKSDEGYEFVLHSLDTPAIFNSVDSEAADQEIIITQNDVREIQKAKGAFLAGARMLLLQEQTTISELDQVLIAGAFGNYIHKENAKFIGLIPDIDLSNVRQIGNAAGIGAQMLLMNTDLRKIADTLSDQVKYVEIANLPEFQSDFANSMIFPHRSLDEFPSIKDEYESIPFR
jgi:uncharacterized 2Fe-2S/4Fe-4S cluster protein (DUF4445 family)